MGIEIEPKKAYSIHPMTKEYIGETVADPDPLVPDNWLIPAGAYLEEPPVGGQNETAVMGDNGWELLPDFRGTLFSKVDGAEVLHEAFGPAPEGFTDVPRPSALHVWSDSGWVVDADLVAAEAIAKAMVERDGSLALAAIRIAPLADAVDLGDASDEDVSSLRQWKQYRVALNRIEQQAGFPLNIEWPVAPS